MEKIEQYIREKTNQFSNEDGFDYIPWLTPDQARKAVEIAREEIYEWLQKVSFDNYKVADEESYRMGCPYSYLETNLFIGDLKKHFNGKL